MKTHNRIIAITGILTMVLSALAVVPTPASAASAGGQLFPSWVGFDPSDPCGTVNDSLAVPEINNKIGYSAKPVVNGVAIGVARVRDKFVDQGYYFLDAAGNRVYRLTQSYTFTNKRCGDRPPPGCSIWGQPDVPCKTN